MKRRYDALQEKNDEREQLLQNLRSATEPDAQEMLRRLRFGEDISSLNLYAQGLQIVDGVENDSELLHQQTGDAEVDGTPSSASISLDQTPAESATRSMLTLEPKVEVTPMVPSLRSLR